MTATTDTVYTDRDFVEAISFQAREAAARASKLSWALDSAMSLWRKAQPGTGYRDSPALGDVPWNAGEYACRIADAVYEITHADGSPIKEATYRSIVKAFGGPCPCPIPHHFSHPHASDYALDLNV